MNCRTTILTLGGDCDSNFSMKGDDSDSEGPNASVEQNLYAQKTAMHAYAPYQYEPFESVRLLESMLRTRRIMIIIIIIAPPTRAAFGRDTLSFVGNNTIKASKEK